MNKKILNISIILMIISLLIIAPTVIYADETNTDNEETTIENTNEANQGNDETQIEGEEKEEVETREDPPTTPQETRTDNNQNNNVSATTRTPSEEHKVAVITTKVDENGNPLKGATLQILDASGKIVDEWVSDGTKHESLLPEGNYTLHEKSAPEGYKLANDKQFTIKVEIIDIVASADYTSDPCEHYGSSTYYVESNGVKDEVYCINQDWETPDDNPIYNGSVITPDNIRNFTQQTVYTDAHQNKDRIDISEQSLTSEQLYDKMLEIIYHRQKAPSIFTDLSENEIRFITEYALKNYTNAGLTRVQRIAVDQAPENYDFLDSYTTTDGRFIWYLYTHFRSFVYDPTQPLGSDVAKVVVGKGDAFGVVAYHWNFAHGAKDNAESRAKLARYYELYQYLIGDSDHHPTDMHLYVYSGANSSSNPSRFNFDDGVYQNLLGIRWFDPYDEEYKTYLSVINTK